jgi:hypothetical protein
MLELFLTCMANGRVSTWSVRMGYPFFTVIMDEFVLIRMYL